MPTSIEERDEGANPPAAPLGQPGAVRKPEVGDPSDPGVDQTVIEACNHSKRRVLSWGTVCAACKVRLQ